MLEPDRQGDGPVSHEREQLSAQARAEHEQLGRSVVGARIRAELRRHVRSDRPRCPEQVDRRAVVDGGGTGPAVRAGRIDEPRREARSGLLRIEESAVGERARRASVVQRGVPEPATQWTRDVADGAIHSGDHAVRRHVEGAAASGEVGQATLHAGEGHPERVEGIVLGHYQVGVAGGHERLRRDQIGRGPLDVCGLEVRAGEVGQPVLAVAEERDALRGRDQVVDRLVVVEVDGGIAHAPTFLAVQGARLRVGRVEDEVLLSRSEGGEEVLTGGLGCIARRRIQGIDAYLRRGTAAAQTLHPLVEVPAEGVLRPIA